MRGVLSANDPERTFLMPSPTLKFWQSGARYRPSAEATGTNRCDMAMIGAAAASDQLQIGQPWQ